MQAGHEGEF